MRLPDRSPGWWPACVPFGREPPVCHARRGPPAVPCHRSRYPPMMPGYRPVPRWQRGVGSQKCDPGPENQSAGTPGGTGTPAKT